MKLDFCIFCEYNSFNDNIVLSVQRLWDINAILFNEVNKKIQVICKSTNNGDELKYEKTYK